MIRNYFAYLNLVTIVNNEFFACAIIGRTVQRIILPQENKKKICQALKELNISMIMKEGRLYRRRAWTARPFSER